MGTSAASEEARRFGKAVSLRKESVAVGEILYCREVAGLLSKPSGLRELFKDNVFVSGEAGDRVTELMKALPFG